MILYFAAAACVLTAVQVARVAWVKPTPFNGVVAVISIIGWLYVAAETYLIARSA